MNESSVKVTVPSRCKGIDMADGTKYTPNSRGQVTIDNPRHVRDYKANYISDGLGTASTGFVGLDPEGGDCDGCGFSMWSWQDQCPRCRKDR